MTTFDPRGVAVAATVAAALMAGTVGTVGGAGEAQAQTAPSRSEAFQSLLSNPSDPALMAAYAQAAIAERDYEAAISTLERLLDIEPANAAARYDLAAAYYALGSYEIARFHFSVLQQQGSLDAARAIRVADYLTRLQDDADGQRLRGSASVAAAVSEDGDAAAGVSVDLRWSVDLGGADDSTWQTDVLGFAYTGSDTFNGNRVMVRTGPLVPIDGLAFGARLRPYAAVERIEDSDGVDYVDLSFGAQYLNAHSAFWSTFADLNFGRRAHSDGADGVVRDARIGASYTPSERTRLRFILSATEFDGDDPADSRSRIGARGEWSYTGTGLLGDPDMRWQASAFAQIAEVDYDASPRRDDLTAIGLAFRGFVTEDAFVELEASQTERSSTDDSFDEREPIFRIGVGWEF